MKNKKIITLLIISLLFITGCQNKNEDWSKETTFGEIDEDFSISIESIQEATTEESIEIENNTYEKRYFELASFSSVEAIGELENGFENKYVDHVYLNGNRISLGDFCMYDIKSDEDVYYALSSLNTIIQNRDGELGQHPDEIKEIVLSSLYPVYGLGEDVQKLKGSYSFKISDSCTLSYELSYKFCDTENKKLTEESVFEGVSVNVNSDIDTEDFCIVMTDNTHWYMCDLNYFSINKTIEPLFEEIKNEYIIDETKLSSDNNLVGKWICSADNESITIVFYNDNIGVEIFDDGVQETVIPFKYENIDDKKIGISFKYNDASYSDYQEVELEIEEYTIIIDNLLFQKIT